MDAQDKITRFNEIEQLEKAIEEDSVSNHVLARRYPVRFIMLDNFETFRKVSTFLYSKGVKSINLEDLINEEEPDEWITIDNLKEIVVQCKETTLITPFSELVRFYDENRFRGFFNEISLYECPEYPNIRIYLPIIGLENRFTDFLRHFGRIQESAPIWMCNTGRQTVNVYLTNFTEPILKSKKNICVLPNLREWLRFWKTSAPREKVICQSKPLFAYFPYSKPDNIFAFNKVANAHDFIINFMETNIPIEYDEAEDVYWTELLSCMNIYNYNSFNFTEFIKKHFNKASFSPSDALETWGKSDTTEFDRWILKGYLDVSQELRNNPYFSLCLNEIKEYDSPENLFISLSERIFFRSQFSPQTFLRYAKERREDMRSQSALFHNLVPKSSQEWIKGQITERVKKQQNLTEAIELCTGCFDFEKVLFLGWYANHANNSFLFKQLQDFYPELSNYLKVQHPKNLSSSQSWAIDYLRCYREAKIKDRITEEITNYISQRNANAQCFYNWYHSFKNEHELLAMAKNNERLKPDIVYWIDGLGAEYFSVLRYFINQEHSDFHIIYSEIGRADIPSSTELNRFEGNPIVHLLDLDEKGHDAHLYKFHQTLIEEIEIVKSLIHRIIQDNKQRKCTIAIVSDHGMTALSRKAKSKKYNDAEHEGRFVKTENRSGENDKDYIFHTNERDGCRYKVALTHASIGKAPVHEVHGGCTPEEVLVPFFILSNKSNPSDFTVRIVNKKVPVSKPTILIEVMPEPTSVEMMFDGRKYEMKKDGTLWSAVVEEAQEGNHRFTVCPLGGYDKELQIEFYGIGFGSSDINDIFDSL